MNQKIMMRGFEDEVTTEIVIYAPSYDPNSGGAVVLHKFCDTLNKTGDCRAYLFPMLGSQERYLSLLRTKQKISPGRLSKSKMLRAGMHRFLLKVLLQTKSRNFATNPLFDTPLVDGELLRRTFENSATSIILYPEITNGNPLSGPNVVRWLLHNPGFHTGLVNFYVNELHFRFSHETIPATIPGLSVSSLYLTILHIPWEYYNMSNVPSERNGVCYSLRKGAHKSLVHDLEGSILIDDRPHSEVASIFKKSRLFISYDSRSAYSQFASLCGCDSVIVPEPGISEENFFKSPESRYGISYGFEGIEAARNTRGLLFEQLKRLEAENLNKANAFLQEVREFFQVTH